VTAAEKTIAATCAGCGLSARRPVADFGAIVLGRTIRLVWDCEGCGIGEWSSTSWEARAQVLASGVDVMRVEHDGSGVLHSLVGVSPAEAARPLLGPLDWLAALVRRLIRHTNEEGGPTDG